MFQSVFDDVVTILTKLWEEDSIYPEDLVQRTPADVQAIVDATDPNNPNIGGVLHQVATAVHNNDGSIPKDPKELKVVLGHCVNETERALLMQDVFGSTDLIIGTHARKIAVALDLFDWEEFSKKKSDIKMTTIKAPAVKSSFKTWLGNAALRAEVGNFHNVMHHLGELLGRDAKGDHGRITKVINHHFSTDEKKCLINIVTSITRFYKACKKRNKVDTSGEEDENVNMRVGPTAYSFFK